MGRRRGRDGSTTHVSGITQVAWRVTYAGCSGVTGDHDDGAHGAVLRNEAGGGTTGSNQYHSHCTTQ